MPDLLKRLTLALADRYAVEKEIGRGGMAVVFLAEDLKHSRSVALKVLHPELTATLGAERFLQEIEIVAGLQHPHILPLYDSGEAEGLLYFVMPYARGESLRHRLDREKQLAVDESVRIAVEVADALDYAHRQGVIHRDIKPGNVLLAEGHATIADFGIARAVEVARQERITRTGLGVGTPLYASPEQATAQETLDGRTDIYSLGCVLYEMLAGEPPLTGATPQMIQARRMSETPTALHTLRDTVPPALDQVIARSLALIPADRYAKASQFGHALQAALFAETPAATADLAETPGAVAMTTPVAPEPRRRVSGWVLFAVPTLGITVVIAGGLLVSSGQLGRGPPRFTVSSITHVTSDPGLEFQPALSPDGSEVAYVEGPIGKQRLVVRSTIDVGSGGESRPAEEVGGRRWYPAWTPDGASLRFLACKSASECGWKEVGSRGGSVRTVDVPGTSSSHAWSGDGTRVAFAVRDSIFAYSADHGEPLLLATHTALALAGLHSLAWSPDGRRIAYVNGNLSWNWSANVSPSSIWIVDTDGGTPVRVTDHEHLNVSPQWLPDSRHLLFVSDRDGSRGIYAVEVGPDGSRGPPRSVLSSSDPHSISVSADGRRLAYSKFTVTQNIWSIPIPRSGSVSISEAVSVTEGNQVIETHALSTDGEWIAFNADIRGGSDIHKMPLGGGPPQLVAEITGQAFFPDWSPDVTEIAFTGRFDKVGGKDEVLVVSADGGAPEQLTDFPGRDTYPDWSPDGLSLAFQSEGPQGEGRVDIWIVSRDRAGLPWSDPVQLTDFGCGMPDWEPDGSRMLCRMGGEIVQVSREGEVLSRYDISNVGLRRLSDLTFSHDGSRIYFIATDEGGSRGVWRIPSNGGDATRVVDNPSLTTFDYLSVGPDNLYLTIAEYESDIWAMDLEW